MSYLHPQPVLSTLSFFNGARSSLSLSKHSSSLHHLINPDTQCEYIKPDPGPVQLNYQKFNQAMGEIHKELPKLGKGKAFTIGGW